MPNPNKTQKEKKRAYDKVYRALHKKERAEYNHKWYEENKESALAKRKEYREKNKSKWREYQKHKYRKCPEKIMARQKVQYAIKVGKITKMPCEVCGSLEVEAHHEDYSKPLDVMWLCKKCHKEHHNKKKGGCLA